MPVVQRRALGRSAEPFTPTRPQRASGLVGRQDELMRILQAIQSDHAHVVLYAERGRGKTSVANRAAELLGHDGYAIGRYVCGVGSCGTWLRRCLQSRCATPPT